MAVDRAIGSSCDEVDLGMTEVLVVYDDHQPPPASIRQIVAEKRFGNILRRRRRLCDVVAETVVDEARLAFVHVATEQDLAQLIERLERSDPEHAVFRLPSCLAPTRLDDFAGILRKLPYALDQAVVGEIFGDEAATLLFRDAAIRLLTIREARERGALIRRVAETAVMVSDHSGLVDLRRIDRFLTFLSGATETRHFNNITVNKNIVTK